MGGSRIIHLRLIISLVMLVQTKLSSETPWSDNSESPFHNRIENGQSLTPVKPCRLHKILSDLFIHDLLKYDSQYLLDLYTRILVGDDSIRTSDKFFHNCAGVLNEFEYQLLLKQLKTRDSSNWLKLRPWYQNVCHLSQSHGKSNEKREDVIPVTLYFAGFILAGKLAINPHDVCHVQKAIGLLIGIINLIRRLICSLKKLEDFLTSVICGSHSSITESDWMYDPNGPPHCNIDYVVFPAFGRLATYRPLYSAETPNSVPYIQLAEAGFEYRNEEFLVQCHECQRKVELGSLTSDPMQSQYHEKGCSHVQASLAPTDLADKENRGSWDSDSDGGFDESDEIETDCPEPVPDQNVQVTNDAYYMRESTENDKTTPSSSSARPITYTVSSDINNLTQSTNAWSPSVDASRQQPPTTVASNEMARRNPEHLNGNISHSIQSSHSSSYSAAPKDTSSSASMCGATDGSSSSTLQDEADEGVDADMGSFEPEAVIDCDRFDNVAAVISIDCKKNKGHYAYFPIRQLQLKHIPSSVRCQEVLKFLKLAASLTVRIVVSATSKKRRSDDPARSVRIRIGTGSCFENDASIGRNDYDGEQGGKWNTVRRLMQLGKRQKMGKIYVETNRHIVFNEEEAENTVVEFFYDHPNRKEIVRVKGVSIQHSRVLGDYKSVLICKTSNLDLVERVNQAREEMKTLVKGFPQAVKEGLQRRIFIISHPHGGEKVLSYGDSVMIKYALTSERRGDKTVHSMVKLNNSQQVTQQSSNVRKVLLYTADTCQGSSGAPVITFQATSTGDSSGNEAGADGGHEVIEMDMWMHNGVDIKHSLGGSVMKGESGHSEDQSMHRLSVQLPCKC